MSLNWILDVLHAIGARFGGLFFVEQARWSRDDTELVVLYACIVTIEILFLRYTTPPMTRDTGTSSATLNANTVSVYTQHDHVTENASSAPTDSYRCRSLHVLRAHQAPARRRVPEMHVYRARDASNHSASSDVSTWTLSESYNNTGVDVSLRKRFSANALLQELAANPLFQKCVERNASSN